MEPIAYYKQAVLEPDTTSAVSIQTSFPKESVTNILGENINELSEILSDLRSNEQHHMDADPEMYTEMQHELIDMRTSAQYLTRRIDHIMQIMNLRIELSDEDRLLKYQKSTCLSPDDVIFEETLQRAQEYGRLKDVDVNVHAKPVHINKEHLRLVVKELVDNAFRFSSETEKVTVASELHDDLYILEVVDRGQGMIETELEKLNVQFGDHCRCGLGLKLVREILDIYHADMSLFSIPCRQTRVRIALPIYER